MIATLLDETVRQPKANQLPQIIDAGPVSNFELCLRGGIRALSRLGHVDESSPRPARSTSRRDFEQALWEIESSLRVQSAPAPSRHNREGVVLPSTLELRSLTLSRSGPPSSRGLELRVGLARGDPGRTGPDARIAWRSVVCSSALAAIARATARARCRASCPRTRGGCRSCRSSPRASPRSMSSLSASTPRPVADLELRLA